jgi:transposase
MTPTQKQILQDNCLGKQDKAASKRAQAILLLEEKVPDALIKAMTGYEKEVVVKLRRRYLKEGFEALASKRTEKSTRSLLTRSQKETIVEILNTQTPAAFGFNCSFWTTSILGQLLEEQYGVKYSSKTSLYLIFKKADFSFHKPEKQSEKRDQAAIDEWKQMYEPIIKEECSKTDTVVLAEDEVVITSQTRLQKVWLPQGKPAFVQDTATRKTTHFYGFLNVQNGECFVFETPQQTGEITVSVLKQIAVKYPNKRIVIFWDNASWHKNEAVRNFLKESKIRFQLYNFPPYSPELNPQEHVWKEMREKVLNNKLITNISLASSEIIKFIEKSVFNYKFLGVQGTFNM